MDFFAGKKIGIVTKHGKEKVIAPFFHQIGAFTIHIEADTDQFGTFSGEKERVGTPLDALRSKTKLAFLQDETIDFAVASEGSFGPHPSMYFIPGDEEWVGLTDKEGMLKVFGYYLTEATNFSSVTIQKREQLNSFLKKVRFPEHGIILKAGEKIYKDIIALPNLEALVENELLIHEEVILETDMRAHRNPLRQEAIKAATSKLVENLIKTCPVCHWPGFIVTDVVRGLPCNGCGNASGAIIKNLSVCAKCQHREEELYPNGKSIDPMYCDYCNP